MTGKTGARRAIVALTCAALLSACVAQYRNHGYLPTDEELQNVIVGVDTRDTVAESVGVPGIGGVLEGGNYYYVGSQVRHYGAYAPQTVDRQIVAVEFDPEGVVSNISRYGLEDGRVVTLTRRVTQVGDGDIGFIRRLFGNIGGLDLSGFGNN